MTDLVGVVGLAAVVAVALTLDVQLPRGGRVPLGHATVLAVPFLVDMRWDRTAIALALAIACVWEVGRRRHGVADASAFVAWLTVGAILAAAVSISGDHARRAIGVPVQPASLFATVVLAGVVYLGVDLVGRGRHPSGRQQPLAWREALPVYIALVCGAALLAIAYREGGPLMASVAAVPLLVLRFSFERYADARETYDQTIRALGMLPEVAGRVEVGHSERAATYAAALAEHYDLNVEDAGRVVAAARLHHIGEISLNEPAEGNAHPPTTEVGRRGAEILRGTGFLGGVAGVVEDAHRRAVGQDEVEAAIVRVSCSMDDLVGDAASLNDRVLMELLLRHRVGVERGVALRMLEVFHARPALVDDARRSGEVLTRAAARWSDVDGVASGDEPCCV